MIRCIIFLGDREVTCPRQRLNDRDRSGRRLRAFPEKNAELSALKYVRCLHRSPTYNDIVVMIPWSDERDLSRLPTYVAI